ncbi:2-oxoacid:acceptor oxidoreductase subunit alpha [Archaeoglobus sp.]|uniref:2-oxoacid:acceptor oxidoreductase subunit alpha n=1 Tax=Archaeoglobus sp. TaxID=1872626 RepID=UPI0025C424C0|nr:2-oxoacid:acceptor oxidoreductase subunit alpha [Archaeoglobus sp.]
MMNVCIAGAAGDGVRGGGVILGKIFSELGYSVFVYQEYQSRIRGGYNASVVRASEREIDSHAYYYDALICLQDYVFERHVDRLRGLLICDSSFSLDHDRKVEFPISETVKKLNLPDVSRNIAAISVFCKLFGVDIEVLEKVIRESFGERGERNIEAVKAVYEDLNVSIGQMQRVGERKELVSGAKAIAEGMLNAGLKFYYAYPMTPASPILHILAADSRCIALQPENEIAAIMMVIGSAFGGERAAVGTSGGGFALMSESISLAGMAEIPVLIILAQRSGPSTGMATFTAQQDLYFALNPAHGEFPLIVASPLTIEDSYKLAGDLLNLAWEFQTPAILLTEKHMTESYTTAKLGGVVKKEVEIFREKCSEVFERYKITESGISPYASPPALVKANSNEHDEYGFATDDAEIATKMYAKRMRKEKEIAKVVENLEPFVEMKNGKDWIVTWGSNFGAVKEVAEELGFSVAAVRFMRPLFLPKISGEMFCVECNYAGLLAKLLEAEGLEVKRILRWDGRPFTPEEIRREIERWAE